MSRSHNNPILGLLALAASLRMGSPDTDEFSDFLAGRQRPRKTAAELLDDPEFREFAKVSNIDLDVATPGCDCPMCVEINKRHDARAEASGGIFAGIASDEAFDPPEFVEQSNKLSVPGILREAAGTYEQRNPLYGDAYKHYGEAMMGFFPQGLTINEPGDWNRLGLFSMMVSKMSRIANNLTTGGHYDSSLDLSVYAAMSAELTEKK